jgi:hypothetical protein
VNDSKSILIKKVKKEKETRTHGVVVICLKEFDQQLLNGSLPCLCLYQHEEVLEKTEKEGRKRGKKLA